MFYRWALEANMGYYGDGISYFPLGRTRYYWMRTPDTDLDLIQRSTKGTHHPRILAQLEDVTALQLEESYKCFQGLCS